MLLTSEPPGILRPYPHSHPGPTLNHHLHLIRNALATRVCVSPVLSQAHKVISCMLHASAELYVVSAGASLELLGRCHRHWQASWRRSCSGYKGGAPMGAASHSLHAQGPAAHDPAHEAAVAKQNVNNARKPGEWPCLLSQWCPRYALRSLDADNNLLDVLTYTQRSWHAWRSITTCDLVYDQL